MFQNSYGMALNMAFPDVVRAPAPPLPFIPVPAPDMSFGSTVIPGTAAMNCLVSFTPAHHIMSMPALSNGDQIGPLGGMLSQIIMGPTRHNTCSFKTFMGCMPVTRMCDMTTQNLINTVGLTVTPAQIGVMSLA